MEGYVLYVWHTLDAHNKPYKNASYGKAMIISQFTQVSVEGEVLVTVTLMYWSRFWVTSKWPYLRPQKVQQNDSRQAHIP